MSVVDQSQVAGSTLGYAQITSNFSTASTTVVQVTGLTATVTIPAGGRRVKITAYVWAYTNTAVSNAQLSIWDGTVGSGTMLNKADIQMVTSTPDLSIFTMAVVTPAAGSKTYNVGFFVLSGTGTLNANATGPAFILVELI